MRAEPRRPAVTVAVLGGGDKRRSRDLVGRLLPELRRGDDVVLLGPRADGASAAAWRHHGGRPDLVRPASVPALHPLVLVLDDRVQPRDGLVGALVAHAADAEVGAVGARSNVADGPELYVGVPYQPGDVGARRAFLRAGAGGTGATVVAHLGGPAVLLRRDHLEAAGGLAALAAGTGLAAAVADVVDRDRRLLVAEDAYVHHPGGPPIAERGPWPLVSACLIVKDEEEQLAGSLAAAAALADELVVYDTGSADGTVELARRAGATVLEGYWDGDFGRARNAALAACRGQWILWVDADETLTCDDPDALRAELAATPSDLEAYLLLIDNLQGTEASTTLSHPAARLFRRAACRWEGRLHEQIVRSFDGKPPYLRLNDRARILHRGYLQAAVRERTKGERNLRTAFDDLAGGSQLGRATRVVSLARSYLLAGRTDEAMELAERALDLEPHPSVRRLALRALVECALVSGRFEDALETADRYRAVSRVHAFADVAEGRAHLGADRPEAALAALDRLRGPVVDDDGFELRPSLVAVDRARALVALDRHHEAASVLLDTLRNVGGLDAHVGLLVECLERSGRDLGELFRALPAGRLAAFFPPLLQLQPDVGDRVLEAWHPLAPMAAPLLATAAQLASRLGIDRQLVWSARLRQAGLSHACPLLASAARAAVAPVDRLVAACVAWGSFRDERALALVGPAARSVPDQVRPALAGAVAGLAPDLAGRLEVLWAASAEPDAAAAQGAVAPDGASRHAEAEMATVVVARRAAAPEALAHARRHRASGATVVLVQPDPDADLGERLASEGIMLRGWYEERSSNWDDPAFGALTACAIERSVSEVVLCRDTDVLAEPLRDLLPAAAIHGAPSPIAAATSPRLTAPVPVDQRAGVCVAAATRAVADPVIDHLHSLLVELASRRPDLGLVQIGDGADGRLRAAIPGLLSAGPVLDPDPFLACAKVVLTLAGDRDGDLLGARARQLATAVVTVDTAAPEGTDELTAILDALAATDLPDPAAAPARARATQPTRAASTSRRAAPSDSRPPSTLVPADTMDRSDATVALRLPAGATLDDGDGSARALAALLAEEGDAVLVDDASTATALPATLEVWLTLPSSPGELLSSGIDGPRRVVALPSHLAGGPPAAWLPVLREHVLECWVSSSTARDEAIARGLRPEAVRLVPAALDPSVFTPDGPARGLAGTTAPRVVACAAATLDGGLDALLEVWLSEPSRPAAATLVVQLLAAPYGLAPEGWLETALRRVAADSDSGVVVLDPVANQAEVAAILRAGDLYLSPRRLDDGGRLVAAAQACGLAVIATEDTAAGRVDASTGWTVGSVPRQVPTAYAGRWTGLVWAEPSREALAAALHAALDDPSARARRGAAALERVRRDGGDDDARKAVREALGAAGARRSAGILPL